MSSYEIDTIFRKSIYVFPLSKRAQIRVENDSDLDDVTLEPAHTGNIQTSSLNKRYILKTGKWLPKAEQELILI